ncbi:MAG: phosphatidate cytidylyltransferase [bacterium]|nr:phosphatidate cytidylyltransferase [bacterium]
MKDLSKRFLIAAIGIPLFLGATRCGTGYVAALVVALQLAMFPEWIRLWPSDTMRFATIPLLVGLAGTDALIFSNGSPIGVAVAVIALGFILLFAVIGTRSVLLRLGKTAVFVLYIAVPLALWTQIHAAEFQTRLHPAGALAVLWITVWACDSAAFFIGRAIGRHPLWPEVSPNKTVEGFFGGLIGAAIVLPILTIVHWATPGIMDYFAIPLLVGLSGQAGDLLESRFKRDLGIKDTSRILPGHGGLLDRFDSLLGATPVFFAYLILTTP